MTPDTFNYGNQYRGDTLDQVQFTLKSGTSIIDLTDVSVKCQFRQPFQGKIAKEITNGDGITIANPTLGVMVIDPFILDWDAGTYIYDIEFTYPSGAIKTYIKGTINIISDTTV